MYVLVYRMNYKNTARLYMYTEIEMGKIWKIYIMWNVWYKCSYEASNEANCIKTNTIIFEQPNTTSEVKHMFY